MDNTIYILNHYSAGVILFGGRTLVRRHSLSKVNLENYQAVMSVVNINNVHWKFLYIHPANKAVYLVDPAPNSSEDVDSNHAAKTIRDYIKMRRTCHGKMDWVDVKWKGGVMQHPCQQDGSSCGVIVVMMARAVMEAFPAIPVMTFGTTKKEMAHERKKLAVFEAENNCHVFFGKASRTGASNHRLGSLRKPTWTLNPLTSPWIPPSLPPQPVPLPHNAIQINLVNLEALLGVFVTGVPGTFGYCYF